MPYRPSLLESGAQWPGVCCAFPLPRPLCPHVRPTHGLSLHVLLHPRICSQIWIDPAQMPAVRCPAGFRVAGPKDVPALRAVLNNFFTLPSVRPLHPPASHSGRPFGAGRPWCCAPPPTTSAPVPACPGAMLAVPMPRCCTASPSPRNPHCRPLCPPGLQKAGVQLDRYDSRIYCHDAFRVIYYNKVTGCV